MTVAKQPLGITDVVLRDAHQSILATRVRLEDMLPIAAKLDQVGFWSVESWGGATFDACIRYLGEDPWERIRELKKAMPNTRQQMLLRGQNLWATATTPTMWWRSSSSGLLSTASTCSVFLMR
jgi:Pyruvate/oxaloacetate carboxyltransferase